MKRLAALIVTTGAMASAFRNDQASSSTSIVFRYGTRDISGKRMVDSPFKRHTVRLLVSEVAKV